MYVCMYVCMYDLFIATSHLYRGKTRRRTEQASSDEGLWQKPKRQGKMLVVYEAIVSLL